MKLMTKLTVEDFELPLTNIPATKGITASDVRKAFKDKRAQFVQAYLEAVDAEIARQVDFKDKTQLTSVKVYLNQSVGLLELQDITYALEMRGYTTLFESANNAFIVRW